MNNNICKNDIDKWNNKKNEDFHRLYNHEQNFKIKNNPDIIKLNFCDSLLNCNKVYSIANVLNDEGIIEKHLLSHRCKNRLCYLCEKIKSNEEFFDLKKLLNNIYENYKDKKCFFVTFTLPNLPFSFLENYRYYSKNGKWIEEYDQEKKETKLKFKKFENDFWKKLNLAWKRFSEKMKRDFKIDLGDKIKKIEWTNNFLTNEMNTHLHSIIALDKKFVEREIYLSKEIINKMKKAWTWAINNAFKCNYKIIDVRVDAIKEDDLNGSSGELAKYVSKDFVYGFSKNTLINNFEKSIRRLQKQYEASKVKEKDYQYKLNLYKSNIEALNKWSEEDLIELEIRQRLFIKKIQLIHGSGLFGKKELDKIEQAEEEILKIEKINKFHSMYFYEPCKNLETNKMESKLIYKTRSLKNALSKAIEREFERYENSPYKEKNKNYEYIIYSSLKKFFVNKLKVISIPKFDILYKKITKKDIPIDLKNIKQYAELLFYEELNNRQVRS